MSLTPTTTSLESKVIRCPTAACAPTTGTISEEDKKVLHEYWKKQEARLSNKRKALYGYLFGMVK